MDGAARLVTSDSRWSYKVLDALGQLHAVLLVDDTDFDKIEVGSEHSFVFAGPSALISRWKLWARDSGRSIKMRPGVETNFAMCIIDMKDHSVRFEHGQQIVGSDHRFAGTGAYPAYQCWSSNKDAIRCVSSAAVVDVYSRGTVRSLDLATGKHNVGSASDFQSINAEMLNRGMVMYTSNGKKLTPIDDAINNGDPFVKKMASNIANGSVQAEAPSGKDEIVWTDVDVKRLDDALEATFGNK